MAGTSTLRNTATKTISQSQNFQNQEVPSKSVILVSFEFMKALKRVSYLFIRKVATNRADF